jgi:ferritin-like protein
MDLNGVATRRQLLARGAGIGVTGAALLVSASAPAATTKGAPTTEPQRIQRLLSVELLLVYCYQQVIASSLLSPAQRRALMPLRANEEAHVRALARVLKQLGGVQPPPPRTLAEANKDLSHRKIGGRLGQLKNSKDALYLLLSAERVAVGAYFVALAKLESGSLLTLSAEIMANDAQHEALIGELLNKGKAADAVPYGLVQGVQ